MKRFFQLLLSCVLILFVALIACGKTEKSEIDTNQLSKNEEFVASATQNSTEAPVSVIGDSTDSPTEQLIENPTNAPAQKKNKTQDDSKPQISKQETQKIEPFNVYYDLLNDTQKFYYKKILLAIQNGVDEISFNEKSIYKEYLSETIDALLNDHPEIFWVESQTVEYVKELGTATKLDIKYNDLLKDKDKYTKEIESVVKDIKSKTKSMSAIEKELYIHDYLIDKCSYKNNKYDQTIYSSLILGETVCAGYAKAFQYLCNKCGINTTMVTGSLINGDSSLKDPENHGWNLVKIDNEWYAVDVTNDDSRNIEKMPYPSYKYFNFNDSKNKMFQRSTLGSKLPAANGIKNTIKTKYKMSYSEFTMSRAYETQDKIFSLNEYKEKLFEILKAGKNETLRFIVSSKDVLDEICDWLSNDSESELNDYMIENNISASVKYDYTYFGYDKAYVFEQNIEINYS